jgi:hypothetical protein
MVLNYGMLGVVVYLALVRLMRYRFLHRSLDKYLSTHTLRKGGDGTSPSDYPMTPAEAQKILRISSASDMPYLVEKSLEFALFKTYGIVSQLLCTVIQRANAQYWQGIHLQNFVGNWPIK